MLPSGKTPEQQIREGMTWEPIEEARARKRQQEQNYGRDSQLPKNFSEVGEVRNIIARRVGLGSGVTYEHGKAVVLYCYQRQTSPRRSLPVVASRLCQHRKVSTGLSSPSRMAEVPEPPIGFLSGQADHMLTVAYPVQAGRLIVLCVNVDLVSHDMKQACCLFPSQAALLSTCRRNCNTSNSASSLHRSKFVQCSSSLAISRSCSWQGLAASRRTTLRSRDAQRAL